MEILINLERTICPALRWEGVMSPGQVLLWAKCVQPMHEFVSVKTGSCSSWPSTNEGKRPLFYMKKEGRPSPRPGGTRKGCECLGNHRDWSSTDNPNKSPLSEREGKGIAMSAFPVLMLKEPKDNAKATSGYKTRSNRGSLRPWCDTEEKLALQSITELKKAKAKVSLILTLVFFLFLIVEY